MSFVKCLAAAAAWLACSAHAAAPVGHRSLAATGVTFKCSVEQQPEFTRQASDYLQSLGIKPAWLTIQARSQGVNFALAEPLSHISPLDFHTQAELNLRDEMVSLPKGEQGELNTLRTVSRQEIALALMHPGRHTEAPCDLDEFKDHLGIRQNIVAWSERLYWQWPEGEPAQWNPKHWNKGTPTSSTLAAFYNAFQQQELYGIGCYTATKMVVAQGVLDYYARVRPDVARLAQVLTRLESDKDPLVGIEPAYMWHFEDDHDPRDNDKPGKLLTLQQDVKPLNFVPGDWAYLLNPDPVSYAKTGYEGSNAIYLGRGKFDDYYNDHSHAYSYRQKLDEVYQWRNGVFSRTRDAHKVTPLAETDLLKLSQTPQEGGLVLSYRAVPYFFKSLTQ